jgi:histidine ammonia-lyase
VANAFKFYWTDKKKWGVEAEGEEAMERAGINPVQLDFKEGIALDNGTQLMTAITALTVCDTENLTKTAEIATALSLEALLGISDAFGERIHKVRPRKGQAYFACESTWLCLILENC